jgi:hypothetical protein
MEAVQMNYPDYMDHVEVLREKVGRLRVEIAQIQELNKRFKAGMAMRRKSLTVRGKNGYKQSSENSPNSLSLAVGFGQ